MKFKPYYTDVLLVIVLFILGLGIIKISRLEREQQELKKEIKSKDSIILEYETEIDLFEDIFQEQEMEIKYWGMKYDSIKK